MRATELEMKLEDEKRGTAERTNERTNDQMIYLVPQMRATELEMKLEDEKRRTAEANSHARKNEISSNDMKVKFHTGRGRVSCYDNYPNHS